MTTLVDAATLAAQKYAIISGGETLSSDDATFIQGCLTRALAVLATPAYGLATWTIDDTPDAYLDAFIEFAAPDFVPSFQPVDEALKQAWRASGLARLREALADPANPVGTADYY